MTNYNKDYADYLKEYTDVYLDSNFLNIIQGDVIYEIKSIKNDIIRLLDDIKLGDELPDWFIRSIKYYTEGFSSLASEILKGKPTDIVEQFVKKVHNFRKELNYALDPNDKPTSYTPYAILEMYSKVHSLSKQDYSSPDNSGYLLEIEKLRNNITDTLNKNTEEYLTLKKEQEASIALLNKEVGKLGVRDYADIFESQANEHSGFSIVKKTSPAKWKYSVKVGKSQIWVSIAILLLLGVLCAFSRLDEIFKLKEDDTLSPFVLVHIVGRFLFISLIIFVISFAFKQYRVNMHLYTLNKHRANTLKSFEYLSRAPDKLDPQSYNAILMEVAKAIYESGQTGYINASDSNNDMPSIIDMSKVITQPKN